MNQILKILQIATIFRLTFSCPFTDYETSLLSSINPQQQTQIKFSNENIGDSTGFGFWSQCIPFWNIRQQKQVDIPYNPQQQEDGQFFFLLKEEISQTNVILSYVEFDQLTPSINHKIIIQDTQQSQLLSKSYPPLNYEGIWILTYFTLQLTEQKLIVEMSNQNKEVFQFSIQPGDYNLIIGGRGYISIGQQSYNLNSYLGRLSKLFVQQFDYDDNHFSDILKLCEIPPKIIGAQEIYLLQGLKYFDGHTSTIQHLDQYGNRYSVFGWFKFDASKVTDFFTCQIMRITVFQDLTLDLFQGDQLFQISYSGGLGIKTIMVGIVDQYNIPVMGIIQTDEIMKQQIFTLDVSTSSVTMFEVIQSWHFIQFEYGRTSDCRTLFSIYYSKIDQSQQLCLATPNQGGQYTNTRFYVLLGGSTFVQVQNLVGYLYDIKFMYNYSNDLEFLLSCHYSCNACFGPYQNNCKSCPLNSNRQLLPDQGICKCDQNYLDIYGQSICVSFQKVYPSIQESENQIESKFQCNFGYFQIFTSDNQYLCIQCPQYQSQILNCVDCLFHPTTWFSNPVCTQQMVAYTYDQQGAFFLITNDPLYHDIYYIDQNFQPQLYLGVQSYCHESTKDCYQTQVRNLGNKVLVICKQNHFFFEDQCKLLDPYCIASQNELCIQCQDNYYLFENKCYNCPLQCQSCYYNNQKVNCKACIIGHALVDDDCKQCGRNCEICFNYNHNISGTNYLRCFKCVDQQKYFLSLDAVNCLENEIKNCLLAFQVLEENNQINSLDYYFVPQQSGKTVCAACARNYLYEIPTQSCIDSYNVNCVLSVSNVQNPDPQDQICLFAHNSYGFYQFQGFCYAFIKNCDTCIYGRQNNFLECLICNAGYYAQRLTGFCQLCPLELNCVKCYQQNKDIKDHWKLTAQAFYRYFINRDFKHAFMIHGQSQNIDDYEIVCNSCQPGYELFQHKCILSCPDQCLECQMINGQNICIKCFMNEFGRQLSLSNNNCIQCQSYCALCRIRTQEEITSINPYFQSQEFLSSTYQCIKPYEQFNKFYDQQLGQFIECQIFDDCRRIFTIVLHLYCSINEYNYDLGQLTNQEDIRLFKQNNILIDDLFSNKNFIEFEQNQFYFNANEKSIKLIQIQIVSQKQQICLIEGDAILTQQFSSNIFSALNVQIEFVAWASTTIQFDKTITFANFTSISFRNIYFQSNANERIKFILFDSKSPQVVAFYDCIYEQLNTQTDSMQMIFNYLQRLEFINFVTKNLILADNKGFLLINGREQFDQLIITGLTIQNSSLTNMDFLEISGKNNVRISLSQFNVIDSTFYHSQLIIFTYYISYEAQQKETSLSVQQMLINYSTINSHKFMDISEISELYIESLTLQNSVISQTILISFGNNASFQDFKIQNCLFQEDTNLMQNLNNQQSEEFNIYFSDFLFDANQYDPTVKFIKLLSYSSKNQTGKLNKFHLSNNEVIGQINYLINYQSSLIYISQSNIIVQYLTIERGIGLPELSFVNSNYLKIEYLTITQGEKYKFRPLTKYLDCILQHLTQPYYPPSVYIRSSDITVIKDINIYSIYTYNQPLLYFFDPNIQKTEQNSQILIQDGFFTSNILVIQQQLAGVALVFIQSNQLIEVTMYNLTFFGNLLHEYVQTDLIQSSALLNINCLQCKVKMIQLTFTSNMVLNSTDSIIYINSQTIFINRCMFQSNSQFQYQIIRPFVIWGKGQIYLEQLEGIFKILSFSGNGVFLSQDLKILNSDVSQTTGQEGGAFKIMLLAESYFECNNTQFDQILLTKEKPAGILNINTQYSSSSIIKTTNLKITNSFGSSLGGIFYINNGQGKLDIYIQKIQIQNVYAKLGSIIYCSFLSTSKHSQSLLIKEISYENNLETFAIFLSKFTTKQKQEISEILNTRSLIYIEYGTIVILQNFLIRNIQYESLLNGKSLTSVILDNIIISHSVITPQLINIVPNANEYFSIGINNLKVQDCIQIELSYEFMKCFQTDFAIQGYQFQCQNIFEVQILPQTIETKIKINDNLNECFTSMNQYYLNNTDTDAGMINIAGLNYVKDISIFQIIFQNITCTFCNLGLLSLFFLQQSEITHQIKIQQIQVKDSQCGTSGCVVVNRQEANSIDLSIYELYISDYVCTNNTASFGTCLNIKSLSSILKRCTFKGNLAQYYGGAIYLAETKSKFIIKESIITQNQAKIGGGIYSLDSVLSNQVLLKTINEQNIATFYGNYQKSVPQFIKLSINQTNEAFENYIIEQNENLMIQGVFKNNNIIHLPSGQSISEYYYYDWKTQSYIYPNLVFRIRAVDEYNTIYKNLVNHYCLIKSRTFNISNKDQLQFTDNFTNIQKIYFNNNTQDFNLDNLSIYFDSDQPNDIVLQLQFWCSPIVVPIFNQQEPYNLLKTHNNYYLRMNIKTLPCSFGQIKNITDQSCYMCNSSLNQFSLKIDASKCQIMDDITTISVESAKLQLKQYYWRPYFDTSDVSYCLNLPENCQGGWIQGDNSCIRGHLGALCESCDLYNIKGEGYYSISEKYTCGLCSSNKLNLGVMIGTILWTLLSLILSVKSTLQTAEKHIKQTQSKILGFTVFYKIAQSGVIIKILTNYLQIIASLSTFQLHLPINISNIINVFGNPIQSISYSQDCIISKFWNIQIHYSRIIWQLLQPFFFYMIFLIIYLILVKTNTLIFNYSVLSTSILYLFIYFQPNWIYELISLISYRYISGFQWIQNNVSYRYDTYIHQQWIIKFCLPIIILLIVIIPILLLFGLILNRHKLNNKQTKIIWGYLYNEYRLTSYFWEILKIVEKDLIIIVLVYYEEDVVIKGILVILIVQIYQVLNSIYQPYYLYKFNSIDMQTSNVCQISFTLGVGIYISDQHQIKNLFYVLLAVFNLFEFISLIIQIIQAYIKEAEEILDSLRNKLSQFMPSKFKNRFLNKLLINQGERRKMVEQSFLRIKGYLIHQARIRIELKKPENFQRQVKSSNFQLQQQMLKNRVQQFEISIPSKSPLQSNANPIFQHIRTINKKEYSKELMKISEEHRV